MAFLLLSPSLPTIFTLLVPTLENTIMEVLLQVPPEKIQNYIVTLLELIFAEEIFAELIFAELIFAILPYFRKI